MAAEGYLETVKEWWQGIDFDKIFGSSSTDAVQVAIFFVTSFAVGFLFKKYLKFIFMCLLMSFLLIKGLEYYKVLDIDWEQLNILLGFKPQTTFGELTNLAVEWIKVNVVVSVSAGVGFLIGYKLG